MKLMFSKATLEGRWFRDREKPAAGLGMESPEDAAGYTEKVPPDTAHVWDGESGEWALPEPEAVPETGCGEPGMKEREAGEGAESG